MDGLIMNCGVVLGFLIVVYLISLVCLVMERIFYIYFVFEGVEVFVRQQVNYLN